MEPLAKARELQTRLAAVGAPFSYKNLNLSVYDGVALGMDANRLSNEQRKQECLAVLKEMKVLRLDPAYEFAHAGFDHAQEQCAIWMNR